MQGCVSVFSFSFLVDPVYEELLSLVFGGEGLLENCCAENQYHFFAFFEDGEVEKGVAFFAIYGGDIHGLA